MILQEYEFSLQALRCDQTLLKKGKVILCTQGNYIVTIFLVEPTNDI